MAPPPVHDRTQTLAPREDAPSPPVASSRAISEEEEALLDETDDPDRYQQVNEHARGGLGKVTRAIDKRLGRTVAVKELLKRSPSNEARFMREALITARLEHPGIVPVHEAGRWPNGHPSDFLGGHVELIEDQVAAAQQDQCMEAGLPAHAHLGRNSGRSVRRSNARSSSVLNTRGSCGRLAGT